MTIGLSDLFDVDSRKPRVSAIREHGFRLDASFHASDASDILETFANGHAGKQRIFELARVFGLSDFGLLRIPADEHHGVPFYTVSDIQEHEPVPVMFLSTAYEPNLSNYVVSKGDVLISRSGSVGNVTLVGDNLHGRAVANHALRVLGNTPEMSSLIYVALSGDLGKSLLTNLRYGSVIDQIKSFQIEAISIPVPSKTILNALHSRVAKASELRDEARQLLVNARSAVLTENHLPRIAKISLDTLDLDGAVEAIALPSSEIRSGAEACEFRLEENFYNLTARAAIQQVSRSPSEKRTVGELSHRVIIGARFKRNYVASLHGIPFLSGRSIVQTRPTDLKYLSASQTEDLDQMLVKCGWILVTRSGTIGRTCFVWKNFENYAASEHILRVLPDDAKVDPGYLYAFLSSEYGYEQIIRFRYGSVIDEITEEQLKKVVVAIPSLTQQQEIGDRVRLAYDKRAEALRLEDEAQRMLIVRQ